MSVELTEEEKHSISQHTESFQCKKHCKIRHLAKFVGTLVAACPAVKYGTLYTKSLEREKYIALIRENGNFDKQMPLSASLLSDIKWWSKNIQSASKAIKTSNFKLEIFTDASLSSWGAVSNGNKLHGWWDDKQSKFHINQLELLAAFCGLKCFARIFKSSSILLRIDNTTAISYINRMGSIQYPKLTNLCKEIWKWCEQRDFIFSLRTSHLAKIHSQTENRVLCQKKQNGN